MKRVAERGEIWSVDLNPGLGREQLGLSPVFVVSKKEFNRLGLVVICPISPGGQLSRFAGFVVPLMGAGTETQGVVNCNQPRTIDLTARNGRFIEAADSELTDEVMARVQVTFDL